MRTVSTEIVIEPEMGEADRHGNRKIEGYSVIERQTVTLEERDLERESNEELVNRIKRMSENRDDMAIARRLGISLRKVRSVLHRDQVDIDENWQEPATVSRIIATGVTEQEARRIKRREDGR